MGLLPSGLFITDYSGSVFICSYFYESISYYLSHCDCYYIHVGEYIKDLYRFIAQKGFELMAFCDSHLYENLFFSVHFLFAVIEDIRILR